jgi:hypothetical protein
MPKFRKKPVEIEAFQMTDDLARDHILGGVALPFGIKIGNWDGHPARGEVHRWMLSIKTLEGRMRVDPNDWIIKGVEGELYPCKPDIFAATYDAVD